MTPLERIDPIKIEDFRGSFTETYRKSVYGFEVVQTNLVETKSYSVFRGLHCNVVGSTKLVRVLTGYVVDVAVCVNVKSPDFGKVREFQLWRGCSVLIPKGYAHGLFSPSDSLVEYHTDREYDPVEERGLNVFDPELAIDCIRGFEDRLQLSQKDKTSPGLRWWKENHEGFV